MRQRAVIAGTAAVLTAAAGVSVAVVTSHRDGGSAGAHPAATSPAPKPPPVHVTVAGARHGKVPSSRPLRLRVTAGSLVDVSVRSSDGAVLPGTVRPGGAGWVSSAVVVPDSRYRVTVRARDRARHEITRTLRLASGPAPHVATTAIAPLTGRTVGVGQPIVVRFSSPITHRAAAERALRVSASTPVTGAWHWISDTEVHFRPRHYWPAHEHVVLDVAMGHVEVAKGVWGEDRTVTFDVGDAHVSTVDVAAHTMTVRSNGTVLRVLKVSTGRDKYPTRGGPHIVIEKQPKRIMDSATVGIPKGDPDYYYETVLWDVRISYGGAFVHAAPWSVADQGVRNVSHGCVNLSPADAEWFYGLAQPGDVVDIVNATAPPLLSDPGMADWNLSWSGWLAGSSTGAFTTGTVSG